MNGQDAVESARLLVKHGHPLTGAVARLLLVEVDRLAHQIEKLKCVIGPVVPKCCDGCKEEWAEALRILEGTDE